MREPDRERIDRIADDYRAHCAEHGYDVLPCGRVSEATAAELLGLAVGTLENKRRADEGPPAYRHGPRGSKWSYFLTDLADWVLGQSADDSH